MSRAGVRRAAYVLAGATVFLTVAGLALLAGNSSVPLEIAWGYRGMDAVPAIPAAFIGALVLTRRPNNRIGWMFLFVGLGSALALFLDEYSFFGAPNRSLPFAAWTAWLASWMWAGFLVTMMFIMLLFPDGKLPSRRWKWVGVTGCVAGVAVATVIVLTPGSVAELREIPNPTAGPGSASTYDAIFGPLAGVLMLSLLAAGISLVFRFRRSEREIRQQIKWFAFFAALVGVMNVLSVVFVDLRVFGALAIVSIAALFVATGIAVLKYRLYDIDVVINKTLVFGALAAFITAVYVAIVVGIGNALGSSEEPNLALSIAATAIVAIAFQPVKERVQIVANRLVYGHRQTPYEVMAGLSHAVSGVLMPKDILPAIAEVTAHGIGADLCRITLALHSGGSITETYSPDGVEAVDFDATVSLMHRGEHIGDLSVSKPRGETMTQADRTLLDDLSAQMGLGLHNARLAIELQERLDQISAQASDLEDSRRRIISAQDDSRARLEQEISRGPRSDLQNMRDEMEGVRAAMQVDPSKASELLETLGDKAQVTLDALRDLARGLFPPLLADKGLVAALEAHVRKQQLDARVEVKIDVAESRFDEQIETVAFFCCVETLRDHVGPVSITIALEPDGLVLSMEGTDVNGETLQAISDRAEAVGGTIRTVERSLLLRLPAQALVLES